MDIDYCLERWALWCHKGGYVPKPEMLGLFKPSESVQSGEVTCGKRPDVPVDDDVERKINLLITERLKKNHQEVLIVEYRILPSIPVFKCQRSRASYLGLLQKTYQTRLRRAKKELEDLYFFQDKLVEFESI